MDNNAGFDLILVQSRAGTEEPPIHVEAGTAVLLSDWMLGELRVVMDGKVFRYSPISPDPSFVINRGFGPWAKKYSMRKLILWDASLS